MCALVYSRLQIDSVAGSLYTNIDMYVRIWTSVGVTKCSTVCGLTVQVRLVAAVPRYCSGTVIGLKLQSKWQSMEQQRNNYWKGSRRVAAVSNWFRYT